MKLKVKYNCGFDENDGDECKEHGFMTHPIKHCQWIIDDENKEDMRLFALFYNYVYEVMGGNDSSKDFGDVTDEEIVDILAKDNTLKMMGYTSEEIKQTIQQFNLFDYFPSTHSALAEPHDHWFNVEVIPVHEQIWINNKFLLKPWQSTEK